MIAPILSWLVGQINDRLGSGGRPFVQVGNIATLAESSSAGSLDKEGIVVTVVGIEEERTLKNQSVYIREGDQVKKIRPTIHLNVNLLFSAADDSYTTALNRIDQILLFFQRQSVFQPPMSRVERVTIEMMNVGFEQQNHLWGILGSKMLPSVLYKLRLIVVQNSEEKEETPIQEIKADGQLN